MIKSLFHCTHEPSSSIKYRNVLTSDLLSVWSLKSSREKNNLHSTIRKFVVCLNDASGPNPALSLFVEMSEHPI